MVRREGTVDLEPRTARGLGCDRNLGAQVPAAPLIAAGQARGEVGVEAGPLGFGAWATRYLRGWTVALALKSIEKGRWVHLILG